MTSILSTHWTARTWTLVGFLALALSASLAIAQTPSPNSTEPSAPISDAPPVDGAIVKTPPKISPDNNKGMVVKPPVPHNAQDMLIEPSTNPNLKKDVVPHPTPKVPPRATDPNNAPMAPQPAPDNRAVGSPAQSSSASSGILNSQSSNNTMFPKALVKKEVDSVAKEKMLGKAYDKNCTTASTKSTALCATTVQSFFPETKIAVRAVGEGEAITMDFSPNRLTIHLDKEQRIKAVEIG